MKTRLADKIDLAITGLLVSGLLLAYVCWAIWYVFLGGWMR